ncbi:hypothetical protein FACS189468_6480 [Spirochaetia bacterium]|nr:hypothetical protein FACS189468_6480 [Spirochaetia bacterium]
MAALFGEGPDHAEGLARALLTTYELIDDQGQPHRYEPDRAVKPLAELFNAILAQVGGTYLAARLALAEGPGFCFYLGGGMHHARYDGGAGFCLLNDIVIAARRVQAENRARLIWVVDVDAHKGDGTAELVRFARERGELGTPGGPDILTLSIHMAQGWPLDEEGLRQAFPGGTPRLDRAPLVPSDVEIPIEAGEEAAYVPKLEKGLAALEKLSGARRPGNPKPDLVIVVDGADPYEHDGLPSSALLKLSLEQCLERDMLIYRYLTGRRIPSAWIEAGGYGNRAWEPEAHFLRGLR